MTEVTQIFTDNRQVGGLVSMFVEIFYLLTSGIGNSKGEMSRHAFPENYRYPDFLYFVSTHGSSTLPLMEHLVKVSPHHSRQGFSPRPGGTNAERILR